MCCLSDRTDSVDLQSTQDCVEQIKTIMPEKMLRIGDHAARNLCAAMSKERQPRQGGLQHACNGELTKDRAAFHLVCHDVAKRQRRLNAALGLAGGTLRMQHLGFLCLSGF